MALVSEILGQVIAVAAVGAEPDECSRMQQDQLTVH